MIYARRKILEEKQQISASAVSTKSVRRQATMRKKKSEWHQLIAWTCQRWQVNTQTHPRPTHTLIQKRDIKIMENVCLYRKYFPLYNIICGWEHLVRRLSASHSRHTDRPPAKPQRQPKLFWPPVHLRFRKLRTELCRARSILAICFLNVAIAAQVLSEFIGNLMSGNSKAAFRMFYFLPGRS